MAVEVKHSTVVAVPDDGTSPVGSDEWNATHALNLTGPALVGRETASQGAASEIAIGSGLSLVGGALSATGGGGAPVGASYVTLGADGTLTSERVLTAGAGVSVTDAGAGSTVTVANTDRGGTAVTTHEAAGDPHPQYLTSAEGAALITGHEGAADPHPGYLTPAEGNTTYAPASHVGASGAAHANVIAAGAAGFMIGTDKTKLDGIATGATANSSDAALLNRANHTGTQAASTISDFNSASRAQTEAALIAGTNITITPAGSGATRTLTIAAAGGGAGTNLSYDASTRVIASDTGADATLPLVTLTHAGLAPASGGGTSNFLRADGAWAAPAGGGGLTHGQVKAIALGYALP